MICTLCHQKKKKKKGLIIWLSSFCFFYLKLNLFSVMLNSFRGKGKQEAGLHEWVSEVDGQLHENSEIVLNFTYKKAFFWDGSTGQNHFHNKTRHSLIFLVSFSHAVFQRLCHL